MVVRNPSSACKPVAYLGVAGCELLPNHTCPAGYHKQAVGPTNPRMKAPTRLVCVPNNSSPQETLGSQAKNFISEATNIVFQINGESGPLLVGTL